MSWLTVGIGSGEEGGEKDEDEGQSVHVLFSVVMAQLGLDGKSPR
jgi:hypothetical protein